MIFVPAWCLSLHWTMDVIISETPIHVSHAGGGGWGKLMKPYLSAMNMSSFPAGLHFAFLSATVSSQEINYFNYSYLNCSYI